jgi:hypothetical protein
MLVHQPAGFIIGFKLGLSLAEGFVLGRFPELFAQVAGGCSQSGFILKGFHFMVVFYDVIV